MAIEHRILRSDAGAVGVGRDHVGLLVELGDDVLAEALDHLERLFVGPVVGHAEAQLVDADRFADLELLADLLRCAAKQEPPRINSSTSSSPMRWGAAGHAGIKSTTGRGTS